MITINLTKIITILLAFCLYTTSIYLYGCYHQKTIDKTEELKSTIQQNNFTIKQLQENNSKYRYDLLLNESINQQIISERDVATNELNQQKTIILKYQNIINKRNHITNDWVRLMDATDTTTTMQQIATYASGTSTTNESSVSAARVLNYVEDLKKDRDNCARLHNLNIVYYNNLESNF